MVTLFVQALALGKPLGFWCRAGEPSTLTWGLVMYVFQRSSLILLVLVAACGRDQRSAIDEDSELGAGARDTSTTAGGSSPGALLEYEDATEHDSGVTRDSATGGTTAAGETNAAAGGVTAEGGMGGSVETMLAWWSPESLVGEFDLRFAELPEPLSCWNELELHHLSVLDGTTKLGTRFAPYMRRWSYTNIETKVSEGSMLVSFIVDDVQDTRLEVSWGPDGPAASGTAIFAKDCAGDELGLELPFSFERDTTAPGIHYKSWYSPGLAFSFSPLSFWFTEPLLWHGNDWPWTCVESLTASSTLLRFTDERGQDVPFAYESLWGCAGVIFDQSTVRGKTLTLHLAEHGNGRDLSGHALTRLTKTLEIHDAGEPQSEFFFESGMPPGLLALTPEASVSWVAEGEPCEQGACLVMEMRAPVCQRAKAVQAAVLGIRVNHSEKQAISVRHRLFANGPEAPSLGYQMQIPMTSYGADRSTTRLNQDSNLDPPYTHKSEWLELGMHDSRADMGYVIGTECWAQAGPPPLVRVVIDRIE